MAAVSRKAWLNNRFEQMDLDDDGYITENDFVQTVREAAGELGRPLDTPPVQRAEEQIREAWRAISVLDADHDGRLSRKEFLSAFQADPDSLPEAFTSTSDIFFDLCDLDGDGRIDVAEFERLMSGFRVPPSVIRSVFDDIDRDHDNQISRDEYTRSWVSIYAK